jgi:hypothetical protein
MTWAFHSPIHAQKVLAAAVVKHEPVSEAVDPDPTAACVTSATGDQTGNCSIDQQGVAQNGQQGNDGSSEEVTLPDADSIQSGSQSGTP